MTGVDLFEPHLAGVPIPAAGLVLRASHGEPTRLLPAAVRTQMVHWTEGSPWHEVCGSTDHDGHWAHVRRVSPRYWVSVHVDLHWDLDEYRLFPSFEDAYAHYAELVTGQQDATNGRAWVDCDVAGVLAGEELRLARRIGLPYADAARQFREDRAAAVSAWALVDVLA